MGPNNYRLIAIGGTNGSGKDTLGKLIAAEHYMLFVSVSELLREELRRRGVPISRENLRGLSAEWRREFGLGVLVQKAMELCESHGAKYTGVVVVPMRNVGEAQYVLDKGGTLIWIDADQRLRYNRIQANAIARGRASEDNKTFEQFQAEEEAEMHAPAGSDAAVLDMAGVRNISHIRLDNNGPDPSGLLADAEKALGFR